MLRQVSVDAPCRADFVTGRHDLTANHDLSATFFDQINAPVKGSYTFETSAHSPVFEELVRARHPCGTTFWRERKASLTQGPKRESRTASLNRNGRAKTART